MSAIQIPGLDIEERSPGTFRVRVRVHPFFALTNTFSNELASLSWGCQQLERMHALHKQLTGEARLPITSLSREAAQALGLVDLITGEGESSAMSSARPSSPGDEILVFDVLDSYLENEAKERSAGYAGRARRLKEYFGNVAVSSITTASLKAYIDERLSGKLGHGRSTTVSYATKNREYQRNLRRRRLGVPVVATPRTYELPSTGSVRHELKLFRQALKGLRRTR